MDTKQDIDIEQMFDDECDILELWGDERQAFRIYVEFEHGGLDPDLDWVVAHDGFRYSYVGCYDSAEAFWSDHIDRYQTSSVRHLCTSYGVLLEYVDWEQWFDNEMSDDYWRHDGYYFC